MMLAEVVLLDVPVPDLNAPRTAQVDRPGAWPFFPLVVSAWSAVPSSPLSQYVNITPTATSPAKTASAGVRLPVSLFPATPATAATANVAAAPTARRRARPPRTPGRLRTLAGRPAVFGRSGILSTAPAPAPLTRRRGITQATEDTQRLKLSMPVIRLASRERAQSTGRP